MQRVALVIGSLMFMASCGPAVPNVPTVGISNGADAARATQKLQSAAGAMTSQAARQLLSGTTKSEFTGTCATSGTVEGEKSVTASITVGAITGTTTHELVAKECYNEAKGFRVSGELTWSTTGGAVGGVTGGAVKGEFAFGGKVAFESFKEDGSIDQSGVIEYDDLKVVYEVTATVDGTTKTYSWNVTSSGKVRVGGVDVTPTIDHWGTTLEGSYTFTGR